MEYLSVKNEFCYVSMILDYHKFWLVEVVKEFGMDVTLIQAQN